jgi:hypothetical protein
MRVLILTDELFASREQSLITRLEVGLADEGVRVVHAVPEHARPTSDDPAAAALRGDSPAALAPGGSLFSQAVTYRPPAMRVLTRATARRVVEDLADLEGADADRPVDVVHVFGGGAWRLGLEVACLTGAGLALEVWRTGLIPRARALHARVVEGRSGGVTPVFIAPDAGIEAALRRVAPERLVKAAPWGVHAPAAPREILEPERAPSVMVVGSGRDAKAIGAALEGLAACVRDRPEMLIFMDALACQRANAWSVARRAGLLGNLSLIHELEGRRDLLVRGDVLVQPEAHGEQRSILLDAMAAGMAVVAGADPGVTSLVDGVTARLVSQPTRGAWALAVGKVLSDREWALSLGRSAWRYAHDQRRASDHVRAVLAAYEQIASGAALPFPGG